MNFLTKRLLLLFFLGSFSTLFAQTRALDSMYNVLKNHPARDTVRSKTINRIANQIFSTNPDKALELLPEAVAIAESANYKKGQAYSLLFLSNAMIVKGQYKPGLQYSQQAMEVFRSLGNKYGMADCHHNYARCHFYLGDYDAAIANYKNAVSLGEETGDLGRQSASLNALGVVYTKQGKIDQAMEACLRALAIDRKQKRNEFGIASDLANIGTLLKNKGDYAGALDYYIQAAELKKQVGDERGVGAITANIGLIYSELDKPAEAMEYYTRAAEIWEKLNNRVGLASCYQNMAIVYMNNGKNAIARKMFNDALRINEELKAKFDIAVSHTNLGTLDLYDKNYPAALSHFEQAVKIHQQLGNRKELSYAYLKMGKIFKLTKDYDKALQYADKGEAIAQTLKLLAYQKDFALLRSEIYFDQEKFKLAYESQAQHKLLMDSILKKDVYDNVADVKYKNVYKDKLNSSKARENNLKDEVKTKDGELQATERQKLGWIIGSLCLLLVLGVVMALVKIRKVKMENKQLLTEQQLRRSQMNPHFIFNSIQNVRSLIHNKQEKDAVDYLNRFSKLTRQILETSNESYTSLEEEIELIRNYISIQQLLYNKAFDFEIEVDDSIDTESTFLPPMLTQPFIENAIKHGLGHKSENGKLEVKFFLADGKLFFEVADNGVGFTGLKQSGEHKSMAMEITKKRLVHYTKNAAFAIHADNIIDQYRNIVGAKVRFEIPYIYEN